MKKRKIFVIVPIILVVAVIAGLGVFFWTNNKPVTEKTVVTGYGTWPHYTFEEGVDSYLAGCKADGIEPLKPFSGKLNLRMPSDLHSRVAAFAASTGMTINDFINKAIRNELEHECAM